MAVDIITKIRQGIDKGIKSVREFRVPDLNWKARSLVELIAWSDPNHPVHEPVLTCDMTLAELINLRKSPLHVDRYNCHGQSMERGVKEVTIASSKVYGFERLDGYVRARLKSRSLAPKPNSKKAMSGMVI